MGKRRGASKGGRAQRPAASLASRLSERAPQGQPSLDPLLYVALHSGTLGDVAFYVAQCLGEEALHLTLDESSGELRPKRPVSPKVSVLELGCGAGRVTLPLLEAGARVVGVDLHEGLLELLKTSAQARGLERGLKLVHEDMRRLYLRERFDVVLITYNTLYCALSWGEQVDCLSRAAAHLKPGGRLIIDGYSLPDPQDYLYETDVEFEPLTVLELPVLSPEGALPDELWRLSDLQYIPLDEEDKSEGAPAPPSDAEGPLSAVELCAVDLSAADLSGDLKRMGVDINVNMNEGMDEEMEGDEALSAEVEARSVGVEERDVHEQAAQRCDVHYRFTWVSGATREEVIEHRYLFPHQLPEMLESAGLELTEWWRDFEPGEPNEESDQWAVSASLKGSAKRGKRG